MKMKDYVSNLAYTSESAGVSKIYKYDLQKNMLVSLTFGVSFNYTLDVCFVLAMPQMFC